MQLWHIVNLPQRLKSVFVAKNHFQHQTQIQFGWPIYCNFRWVNPHCNNLSIFRPFYSSRHHQFLWQLWLLLLDITWIAITMMFVNVTHYIVLWVVIENTPHTSCECLWLFCFWDPKITRTTTPIAWFQIETWGDFVYQDQKSKPIDKKKERFFSLNLIRSWTK